jgi:hypothetical protein
MVGLSIKTLPKSWQLSPENDERAKEIARLKQELARYKRSEPQFALKAVDHQCRPVAEITGEIRRFEPLTESQINQAMSLLESWHPKATSFGSREAAQTSQSLIGFSCKCFGQTFNPATDLEIFKYNEEDDPTWLGTCRKHFAKLHVSLQKVESLPEFRWSLQNIGTRPAEDALESFLSKGTFLVQPPPPVPDDDEELPKQERYLPRSPLAPTGRWRNQFSAFMGLERTANLSTLGGPVMFE